MKLKLYEIFNFILTRKGRIFLRQWIKDCYREKITIIYRNVIREIKFENIPKITLKAIFADLDDYIEKRKEDGHKIVEQVRGFAKEVEYENYLCKGNEVDIDNTIWVSRVAVAGDINSFSRGEKKDDYLDDAADSAEGFENLQNRIKHCQKYNKPFGLLRGDFPIIWVTKSKELEQVKQNSPPEHRAMEVVKSLGMSHIKRGHLVEIQIPIQTFEKLHTPTIVDANFSECFRPAKELDRWGRTIHLGTFSQGLSEAVHPSIMFDTKFPVLDLGRLGPPIKGLTETMEKFISR
ncbi:MAG: hypothetical protein PVF58_22460 [Candidatus Methanofastidiosia archaeon]